MLSPNIVRNSRTFIDSSTGTAALVMVTPDVCSHRAHEWLQVRVCNINTDNCSTAARSTATAVLPAIANIADRGGRWAAACSVVCTAVITGGRCCSAAVMNDLQFEAVLHYSAAGRCPACSTAAAASPWRIVIQLIKVRLTHFWCVLWTCGVCTECCSAAVLQRDTAAQLTWMCI